MQGFRKASIHMVAYYVTTENGLLSHIIFPSWLDHLVYLTKIAVCFIIKTTDIELNDKYICNYTCISLENREYGRRDPSRWQGGILYLQSWHQLLRQSVVAQSV
jgi:hypothetical protein